MIATSPINSPGIPVGLAMFFPVFYRFNETQNLYASPIDNFMATIGSPPTLQPDTRPHPVENGELTEGAMRVGIRRKSIFLKPVCNSKTPTIRLNSRHVPFRDQVELLIELSGESRTRPRTVDSHA